MSGGDLVTSTYRTSSFTTSQPADVTAKYGNTRKYDWSYGKQTQVRTCGTQKNDVVA